jgi:hypothetical protein
LPNPPDPIEKLRNDGPRLVEWRRRRRQAPLRLTDGLDRFTTQSAAGLLGFSDPLFLESDQGFEVGNQRLARRIVGEGRPQFPELLDRRTSASWRGGLRGHRQRRRDDQAEKKDHQPVHQAQHRSDTLS